MKRIRKILSKIRLKYYSCKGYYPAKIQEHDFKFNYEDFGFWKAASKGYWEPETFKALSMFLDINSIYLDIGAWIGPTVLYAAKKCKKVICFEPDPVAYKKLLFNIHLNKLDNVSSYSVTISDKSSVQEMSSLGTQLGDSMTSLLLNKKNNPSSSFEALVLDWDFVDRLHNFDKLDMLKIDIEGAEFALIPAMEKTLIKYNPILWLSLHAPFLDKDKQVEEMQKIIDVLKRCYKICLNFKFEQIDMDEIKNDENLSSFPVFLFKN